MSGADLKSFAFIGRRFIRRSFPARGRLRFGDRVPARGRLRCLAVNFFVDGLLPFFLGFTADCFQRFFLDSLPLLTSTTPGSGQISLTALGEGEVLDTLRRTQVDMLTPLEAMNLLYEFKKKLQ